MESSEAEQTIIAPIPINEIMRFIFGQPDINLSNPDHQELVLKRLGEDQSIIRKKYGLPPLAMLKNNPAEFERQLQEIAKRIGVTILPTIECGSFFRENPTAGAVYLDERSVIGANIKRNADDIEAYRRSLIALEHEIVHALQDSRYKRMPIEIAEYEAYVANMNLPYLINQPQYLQEILDFFLGGSTRNYYRRTGETPPYLNKNS